MATARTGKRPKGRVSGQHSDKVAQEIVDGMIQAEEFIRRLDEAPRLEETESEIARLCRFVRALRSVGDPP